MSRRVYDGSQLVQEWDDDTRTYRRWSTSGVLLEQRAYTAAEDVPVLDRIDRQRDGTNASNLLLNLRAALGANNEDLTTLQNMHDGAVAIEFGADIANLAQGAAAIKQLARGIDVLSDIEARTKRELNGLIRLIANQLDTIADTGDF